MPFDETLQRKLRQQQPETDDSDSSSDTGQDEDTDETEGGTPTSDSDQSEGVGTQQNNEGPNLAAQLAPYRDTGFSMTSPTPAYGQTAPVDPQREVQLVSAPKAGHEMIARAATTGPTDEPLSRQDSQYFLKQLTDLANNPEYSRSAPPDSRQSLRDAMAQAKQLYQEQAARNDWLEVAQTLGRAVAQWGAARSGGRNANMANINMGAPIDYEARNRRALQEYQIDVGAAKTDIGLQQQDYEDQERAKALDYTRQAGAISSGLSSALRGEAEKSAERRAQIAAQGRLDVTNAKNAGILQGMNLKYGGGENTGTAPVDKQARAMQVQDLNRQEKQADAAIQAARFLDTLPIEDAYSDKYKKEREVAQAPASMPEKPGRMWGTNPDPVAGKQQMHQTLMDWMTKKQKIISDRNAVIFNRGPEHNQVGATPPDIQQQQQQPPAGKIKVRSATGQIGLIPPEQLDEALRTGYTKVP